MPSAFRDVSSIGQPVVLDANGSIRAATAGNHIFVTGSLYTGQTAPTGTLQFLNSSGSNIASFTTNGDLYVGGTVQPSSACFAASYEPEKWNSTSTRESPVQSANNCYNYANNQPTFTFAQPGRAHGLDLAPENFYVSQLKNAAIQDGLTFLGVETPSTSYSCPDGGSLVYMAYSPGEDYHWYRRDTNGMWSHKPGSTPATNEDRSGNPIYDPLDADRGEYQYTVGFFCTCGGNAAIR